MRNKATAVLIGSILAGSCLAAEARPAITTYNANLRSGPGVGSPIVAIIPDQAAIDVGACSGSWCRVSWEGTQGFLSRTLIASAAGRQVVVRREADPATAYNDGAQVVAPPCDPSFDASCSNGYIGPYSYDNGYAAYNDYGYNGYGYDNFGVGIYGGGYGYRRFNGAHPGWGGHPGWVAGNRVPAAFHGANPAFHGASGRQFGGGGFAAHPGVGAHMLAR